MKRVVFLSALAIAASPSLWAEDGFTNAFIRKFVRAFRQSSRSPVKIMAASSSHIVAHAPLFTKKIQKSTVFPSEKYNFFFFKANLSKKRKVHAKKAEYGYFLENVKKMLDRRRFM